MSRGCASARARAPTVRARARCARVSRASRVGARGGRCAASVDTWTDGQDGFRFEDGGDAEAPAAGERSVRATSSASASASRVSVLCGASPPKLVVFSGGTAMNMIADELSGLTQKVTHVIPVSDNGGSTSEIVRVLGGPAVGDLRSRCLRLTDESTPEAVAVKALLAYRLHPTDSELARREWYKIQEGDHELWDGIGQDYANIIRRFLVHFHQEVTSKPIKERFDFVNGSIGNFFFAGARLFFRSMDAAIFLYSRVSRIPDDTLIVPCIAHVENERVNLVAELLDGTILRGQNEISHPSIDSKKFTKVLTLPANPEVVSKEFWKQVLESGEFPESEAHVRWGGLQQSSGGYKSVRDALKSGSLIDAAELLKSRFDDIADIPLSIWDVDKVVTAYDPLKSPIKRVFYASSLDEADDNFEVHPKPNPTVLENIDDCDAIVYGIGSLYTSIIPNLCLKGMSSAISNAKSKKILMLNGSLDRETGTLTASEIVSAIVDAVNMRYTAAETFFTVSDLVTDVVYPIDGDITVDTDALVSMGVRVHACEAQCSTTNSSAKVAYYDAKAVVDVLVDIIARDTDAIVATSTR